jgi:hypothetical protein
MEDFDINFYLQMYPKSIKFYKTNGINGLKKFHYSQNNKCYKNYNEYILDQNKSKKLSIVLLCNKIIDFEQYIKNIMKNTYNTYNFFIVDNEIIHNYLDSLKNTNNNVKIINYNNYQQFNSDYIILLTDDTTVDKHFDIPLINLLENNTNIFATIPMINCISKYDNPIIFFKKYNEIKNNLIEHFQINLPSLYCCAFRKVDIYYIDFFNKNINDFLQNISINKNIILCTQSIVYNKTITINYKQSDVYDLDNNGLYKHLFIKILLSTNDLSICAKMIQSILESLNIKSIIINYLDENCDIDDSLYIIIYNDRKINKMPKYYVFWQIEQTCLDSSPIIKFDNVYYEHMQKSLLIFEFSPYNTNFYKNKIDLDKVKYQFLPFYNLNNFKSIQYEYDIVFFGSISKRRQYILNKIQEIIGHKYKIIFIFGVIGEERDKILKKSKYVLNIHFYEDSQLENERFNLALNFDCLIISEDSLNEDSNKKIYQNIVSFTNVIQNNDINKINKLIEVIEYNLQNEIFYEKKQKLESEKIKIQNISKSYLYKNLMDLPFYI